MSLLRNLPPDFLMGKVSEIWSEIRHVVFNSPSGTSINYPDGSPKLPNQNSSTLEDIRKVLLVFQAEGAIKIVNEWWGRRIPFSYTLEVIEPRFSELESEIVELYWQKVDADEHIIGKTFSKEHTLNEVLPSTPTKKQLRKEFNKLMKRLRLSKKETSFLNILAEDFEPKEIKLLSDEVPTKDCKHLKRRIQEKLKGSPFNIKTHNTRRTWGKSCYELIHNSHQLEKLVTKI